ncbi:unnamed protein product [Darwinula stevensoni]|uniref:Glutamyl/glutaminyl-tRNA synthetase class Ib catalytic domain-containing protein n=1 Tax=Darwinula stevensoni TaxID=69355 RepID=A0A7R9FU31_9CRUS|nr:unnamed protein product [Darwinula stevensoni]CAG0908082.1 unnamed protein product [Darwinula stevensoni]
MAEQAGGRFLLRIEDIDTTRSKPDFIEAIFEDLHWLGLKWEEPVRRQSEHFADYKAALAMLHARDLVYPAFMTRSEIAEASELLSGDWPMDPDGMPHYPGRERDLNLADRNSLMSTGLPFGWRLNMKRAVEIAGPLTWTETGDGTKRIIQARPEIWGDVLIARKDVPASYHLSVVVDDALQGISHVVRGQDLFEATAIHRLLQSLLDLPVPDYNHHRLLTDAKGKKLAKSKTSKPLRELRHDGFSPAYIRQLIGL